MNLPRRRYSNPAGVLGLWAVALIVAGTSIVLYCFDPSLHSFYPVCVFHQATGLLCPGCGSLRALHQLLHGNLVQAFRFNPLLMIALPAFAVFGVLCLFHSRRGQPMPAGIGTKWLWLCLGLGLAFSIWRNVPGSTFSMLPG